MTSTHAEKFYAINLLLNEAKIPDMTHRSATRLTNSLVAWLEEYEYATEVSIRAKIHNEGMERLRAQMAKLSDSQRNGWTNWVKENEECQQFHRDHKKVQAIKTLRASFFEDTGANISLRDAKEIVDVAWDEMSPIGQGY